MLNWLGSFLGYMICKVCNEWLKIFEANTLLGFILLPVCVVLDIILLAIVGVNNMLVLMLSVIVGFETLETYEMDNKFKREYKKLISRNEDYFEENEEF